MSSYNLVPILYLSILANEINPDLSLIHKAEVPLHVAGIGSLKKHSGHAAVIINNRSYHRIIIMNLSDNACQTVPRQHIHILLQSVPGAFVYGKYIIPIVRVLVNDMCRHLGIVQIFLIQSIELAKTVQLIFILKQEFILIRKNTDLFLQLFVLLQ